MLDQAGVKGWELRYGDVRSVLVAERAAVKVYAGSRRELATHLQKWRHLRSLHNERKRHEWSTTA
jgi:hypothetical protein